MSPQNVLDDVAGIVVHHNSPGTLQQTLQALVAAGVPGSRILVVDNSDDRDDAAAAAAIAENEFLLLRTANEGYAAAVNSGLRYLHAHGLSLPLTLVATHESISAPDAVAALRDALHHGRGIAVAGPTLIDASGTDGRVWSVGGRLTPLLKLPRHIRFDPAHRTDMSTAVDRDWLDGAFTLYRTSFLERHGLEESYFLYFEETDLHTRFLRIGLRVVWVPRARVSQLSSGIPPRLLGRNLFHFHSRLFSRSRGRAAVGYEVLRSIARAALTSRGRWSDSREIVSGWWSGERLARSGATESLARPAEGSEHTGTARPG